MTNVLQSLKERLYLEQCWKKAQRQRQTTYANCLMKRINGEHLSFEQLIQEELRTLIEVERVSNKEIAFLFDVEKELVLVKRNQWGIKKELKSERILAS